MPAREISSACVGMSKRNKQVVLGLIGCIVIYLFYISNHAKSNVLEAASTYFIDKWIYSWATN